MRSLIAGIALLVFLPCLGAAQSAVYQVTKGTGTVSNFLLNDTAVQVDSSTRTLVSRSSVELWNDDASNFMWCGFNDEVSATATNPNYGRRIGPRSSWTLAVPQAVKIFCVSVAAGIRVVFTQL